MALRVCETCRSAENPLGRLRFKKSRVDGKLYCENCEPITTSVKAEAEAALVEARFKPQPARRSSSGPSPSAGLVVINCPECAGGIHRPQQGSCPGCAGYGSVRIEANMLNVYSPAPVVAPQPLLEG